MAFHNPDKLGKAVVGIDGHFGSRSKHFQQILYIYFFFIFASMVCEIIYAFTPITIDRFMVMPFEQAARFHGPSERPGLAHEAGFRSNVHKQQ